jgi:DNA-binding response OmpR family regulator/predicted regulator of Ras-like GTPase activity (Roadblock/LC7/MglB family)
MHTILLVDYDTNLLRSLADSLAYYRDTFKILTAESGERAIVIIANQRVNLVLTELRMPDMDGFEIIDWMNMHHPSIPVLVMSELFTSRVRQHLEEVGVFRTIQKPANFQDVADAITAGLQRVFQGGTLGGISVGSFLQLMEAEEKTTLVEVRTQEGQRGFMFFDQGRLIDAVYGENQGEKAAIELLTWRNTEIRYRDVPQAKIKQKISTGLMSLLMEASRLEDEGLVKKSVLDSDPGARIMGRIAGGGAPAEEDEDVLDAGPISDVAVDALVQDLLPKLEEKKRAAARTGGVSGGKRPPLLTQKAQDAVSAVLGSIVEEMEHVYACAVLDGAGEPMALRCPKNPASGNGLSKGMAGVLSAAKDTLKDMNLGAFEECMVQTEEAWVLTRLLAPETHLMIAVTRETPLGFVRLMASRYAQGIIRHLS